MATIYVRIVPLRYTTCRAVICSANKKIQTYEYHLTYVIIYRF